MTIEPGHFWQAHVTKIHADNFRGEHQYLGGTDSLPYDSMISAIHGLGLDPLLDRLEEDGAFGCFTRNVDGKLVSRDLLDSVVELGFVRRALGESFMHTAMVLDIGAGYGRLAHRWHCAFPGATIYCTDGVFLSSQLCGKYLKTRGVPSRVILPSELGALPPLDLAVNIHSWPECSRAEIAWWLDWLADHRVPRLFVVPHLDRDMLCNQDGKSFRPDIEQRGYKLAHHWYGPECWPRDFYLFEGSW